MPILRLVMIYLVLALAVVAVFNRDKLGRLVFGDPPAEVVAASAQSVAPAPAPAASPAQPAPGMLQTPQPTPSAPAATPATQTAPGATPDPELAEALNAARLAYWSGDIAGAGDRLASLAAAHPDNPDLHGELGNFRFANRDYAGAAEAFLRAGELLVAEGRQAQASGLLPVLRQIAPDKAQTLATRLQLR